MCHLRFSAPSIHCAIYTTVYVRRSEKVSMLLDFSIPRTQAEYTLIDHCSTPRHFFDVGWEDLPRIIGLSGAIKLSKMSMKMSSSKKQSKNKKIGVDLRGLKCLLRYDDKTYDQLVKVWNAEVSVQTEAIEGRPTSLAILVSKLLASKLIKLQPVKRRQKALLILMSKLMV